MTTEPQEPRHEMEWINESERDDYYTPAAPVAQEPPAPSARVVWMNDGRCCPDYRCNDCPSFDAPHDLPAPNVDAQLNEPAPGSAQEPADPPWLIEAELVATSGSAYERAAAFRAALPILRAGIEQEMLADVERGYCKPVPGATLPEFWLAFNAGIGAAAHQLRARVTPILYAAPKSPRDLPADGLSHDEWFSS